MQHTAIAAPSRLRPTRGRSLSPRQRRQLLEAALERLLSAVEGIVDDLDALDGDADLEPTQGFAETRDQRLWQTHHDEDEREDYSEDEGAQCDDEGADQGDEGGGVCGGITAAYPLPVVIRGADMPLYQAQRQAAGTV